MWFEATLITFNLALARCVWWGHCSDFFPYSLVDHSPSEFNCDFDKVAFIMYMKPSKYDNCLYLISIGVFFRSDFMLTSYNPYRQLLRDRNARHDVSINIMTTRFTNEDGWVLFGSDEVHYIRCARQVVPEDVGEHLIHDNAHPIHDLMVIRIDNRVKFVDPKPRNCMLKNATYRVSPVLTKLAKRSDRLGKELEFASPGFMSERHILQWRILYARVYNESENVIADCDEWIPREWGYFICIRNIDNYPGLGSSAMLLHDNKLFGVGSFLLERGGESVLVFTDVRYYYNLIHMACTDDDQNLRDP